jgi:hypothetical protein
MAARPTNVSPSISAFHSGRGTRHCYWEDRAVQVVESSGAVRSCIIRTQGGHGCVKIVDTHQCRPNDHFLSIINEEDVQAPGETTVSNHSDIDDGHSIGRRRHSPANESAPASRSFELDGNVANLSDSQDDSTNCISCQEMRARVEPSHHNCVISLTQGNCWLSGMVSP